MVKYLLVGRQFIPGGIPALCQTRIQLQNSDSFRNYISFLEEICIFCKIISASQNLDYVSEQFL